MVYLQEKKKALMNSVKGSRLPSEYQEVEWISPTQRGAIIDTGYELTSDYTEYEMEFYKTKNESNALFGAERTGQQYSGVPYSAGSAYGYYVGTVRNSLNFTPIINEWNKLKYINTPTLITRTINDVTNTYAATNNSLLKGVSIYIFADHDTTYGARYSCSSAVRAKSFKITDDNNLVRDFIPCYRKSDNEIGMYDVINDVFYTNQGTGTFTKGADV